jgi:hypothetical protein
VGAVAPVALSAARRPADPVEDLLPADRAAHQMPALAVVRVDPVVPAVLEDKAEAARPRNR